MPIIVAPNTVAESYVSVADADTYHLNRGNASWAALTTTVKEQCLRKATDYMVGEYFGRWLDGYGDLESDAVPSAIANACASMALRANTADLIPDVERAMIRDKIDVLETEWSPYSSQVTQYRAIDAMLAPYLIDGTGGANHRVIRA